nr:MAG TPA: hypothetical protein [Caudoviricetes sp.]DAS91472.1 MAG TPA: hypothetical protein [Caudoviricetes sp.]
MSLYEILKRELKVFEDKKYFLYKYFLFKLISEIDSIFGDNVSDVQIRHFLNKVISDLNWDKARYIGKDITMYSETSLKIELLNKILELYKNECES